MGQQFGQDTVGTGDTCSMISGISKLEDSKPAVGEWLGIRILLESITCLMIDAGSSAGNLNCDTYILPFHVTWGSLKHHG